MLDREGGTHGIAIGMIAGAITSIFQNDIGKAALIALVTGVLYTLGAQLVKRYVLPDKRGR